MKLRDYQEDAVRAIREQLAKVGSTLAVMPTGSGKTPVLAMLAKRNDGPVLVLAHRDELIAAAAEKIEKATGERAAVEQAESRASGLLSPPKFTVASVQTLSRPNRLKRFPADAFSLIEIDEAHHATAATYGAILARFPKAKVVGYTATPNRTDKTAMGKVFDSVAVNLDLRWGVECGWLVPVRQRIVTVDGLDFSGIPTLAGDFHQGRLAEIVEEEGVIHRMVAPTVELAGDDPAIVFCVSVAQARSIATLFNRYKPGSAAVVTGADEIDDRRQTIAAYRRGEIQFLVNCMVFTEGFDAPHTRLIVNGRPTKSLSLYLQMIGRGTRPLPMLDGEAATEDAYASAGPDARKAMIEDSDKPFCTVLDFTGAAGRYAKSAVTSLDALGGNYGEPIRRYAAQLASDLESGGDAQELLERAEQELALRAEDEAVRKAIKARADYRIEDVGSESDDSPWAQRVEHEPMATIKMRGTLKGLGIGWHLTAGWTRKRAGAVIGKMSKERDKAMMAEAKRMATEEQQLPWRD